ncbi:MAG: hypothetical protein E7040_03205 [Lentisphaerae bacterium]|nr:hypothetical protein [Lentisphaerota bacterium]
MRELFCRISVLLLLILTGCSQKSCAAEVEHEFLTPQVVVLKCSKPVEIKKSSVPILRKGEWKKENGLIRDKNGTIQKEADITCYYYLILERALKDQEKLVLESSCGKLELLYSAAVPSNIFKVNQVGNGANQKKKYTYMGAWLGSAGALPLKQLSGKTFEIRNASSGKCVYKNNLHLRRNDPHYQGKIPFTGEEVLELDYSSFNVPGKYYFYVDGIGRSMEFSVGAEALNEAFYIHARGLYHKRCGIAKQRVHTAWESPACHQSVLRGRFPGNSDHYRKGKGEKDFGFFDRRGNRIDVKHFELIISNPPYSHKYITAPGGWHDAADYDRRPYHLRIVSDLAMVYLMKSENFIDGQLNIPESGNGIPDILDEAAWGVKHLLAVQQSDGGVGTWFETVGHPGPGEGLPDQEVRNYYVSAPSRNSTLEYAAAVSTLALAMRKAGAVKECEKYLLSAQKAWDFALNPKNRHVAWFRLKNQLISYKEEPYLQGENLLKAGHNLYLLTGDRAYLSEIMNEKSRVKESFNKDFWRWSVLSWMSLELFPVKDLEPFRQEYRKVILRDAEKMLQDQENAYPYRTLWHAGNAGWVHSMAWGNYHPLRRAVTLIAAHKLTGAEKYLTGAYLANDFHNGANPLGRSMTSGLGKIYPSVFLDLVSYADRAGEFVPGITPYGNTFGIDRNAVKMVYGENADRLPIFRRYVNLEFLSVPSSEYSVWETIAPAAVTTGYLIEKTAMPSAELKNRKPAGDFRKLPGYRALP